MIHVARVLCTLHAWFAFKFLWSFVDDFQLSLSKKITVRSLILCHNVNGLCFRFPAGQQIWQQINLSPVCFFASGQKPGDFQYVGDGRLVAAIKLVYRSGLVRCERNTAYNSRWGCYHHNGYVKNPLNVVITDRQDNILFPQEKFIKNAGLWYYLPFTDALHSNELVFTNYESPFYLPKNSIMKIWYGEDLRNWRNHDNGGRVCVDVYGHLQ